MHRGPRPLSVHIGMMASALPQPDGTETQYTDLMQKMLLGVRQYQLHPYARKDPGLHTLWQKGSVSIKSVSLQLAKRGKPVLLLVPSMVNRAYIFDLMEERSMLRWMAEQGIETCMLDWGEPLQDAGMENVESTLTQRLMPAIQYVVQQTGAPVHLLGYCMGGTLSVGAVCLAPDSIRSAIFLAAPWDFHAGPGVLRNRVTFWAPSVAPLIAGKNFLPRDWVQTVFASLDPLATAKKFARFGDLDLESEEAKIFTAVEDWLNDGVDLPTGMARQPIQEWFIENCTALGEWKIGGQNILPERIRCPSFIVTSCKDRLVEYDMAAVLHTKIPNSRIIDTGCGHVGMMAGRNAVEQAWRPIAEWVRAQE